MLFLHGVQGVASSNLVAPTNTYNSLANAVRPLLWPLSFSVLRPLLYVFEAARTTVGPSIPQGVSRAPSGRRSPTG